MTFDDDQVNVDELPAVTLAGLTLRVTEGAGGVGDGAPETSIVTDLVVLPPSPVHVSVNVLVAVSAPVDSEPDGDFEPVHAPEAWHEVASVDDQVSIEALPLVTAAGSALRVNVGSLASIGHAASNVAPSPYSAARAIARTDL